MDVERIKADKYLVLDTQFLSAELKFKLLARIEDLDEKSGGLLINSDNFQALNFLQDKYAGKIKCVYIDPPYNSDSSVIIYKNNYKHSSWITLIYNRLVLAKNLLSNSGVIEIAIGDEEFHRLESIVRDVFGDKNYVANVAIMHNPKGRDKEHIATAHEYTIVASKDISNAETYRLKNSKTKEVIDEDEEFEQEVSEIPLRRRGSGASRVDRPFMYFPFVFDRTKNELFVIPENEYRNIYKEKAFDDKYVTTLKKQYESKNLEFLLPIRQDKTLGRWRWGYKTSLNGCKDGSLFVRGETIYERKVKNGTYLPKSIWFDNRYDASTKGTNILKEIMGGILFDFPKSVYAVEDFISLGSDYGDIIIDFFAGSGTTGHAIINLKREKKDEDENDRTYILVEMGEYFDTVTKPRIQKVIYSAEWKSGKSVRSDQPLLNGSGVSNGISHIFQYLKLEQYEDSLNNIEFDAALDSARLAFTDQIKYVLQKVRWSNGNGHQTLARMSECENMTKSSNNRQSKRFLTDNQSPRCLAN